MSKRKPRAAAEHDPSCQWDRIHHFSLAGHYPEDFERLKLCAKHARIVAAWKLAGCPSISPMMAALLPTPPAVELVKP